MFYTPILKVFAVKRMQLFFPFVFHVYFRRFYLGKKKTIFPIVCCFLTFIFKKNLRRGFLAFIIGEFSLSISLNSTLLKYPRNIVDFYLHVWMSSF